MRDDTTIPCEGDAVALRGLPDGDRIHLTVVCDDGPLVTVSCSLLDLSRLVLAAARARDQELGAALTEALQQDHPGSAAAREALAEAQQRFAADLGRARQVLAVGCRGPVFGVPRVAVAPSAAMARTTEAMDRILGGGR